MIQLQNIHSLTDFLRNAKDYVSRLKKTGQPEVLTINGEAQLVVQDAESYQKLLDAMDRLEAIAGVRRGLEQMHRSEGRTIEAFDAHMRDKYSIPPVE